MASMALKELADLGFVIAFRFYGRYPETGRSFYHPPPCESHHQANAETPTLVDHNGRRHSPLERSGLAAATSLILPNLAAASLSVLLPPGTHDQGLDVLPSPAPQNVGAH